MKVEKKANAKEGEINIMINKSKVVKMDNNAKYIPGSPNRHLTTIPQQHKDMIVIKDGQLLTSEIPRYFFPYKLEKFLERITLLKHQIIQEQPNKKTIIKRQPRQSQVMFRSH